jgi:malate/lactate dehydrogenase
MGKNGVEKILEVDLTAKEREALHQSAGRVKELIAIL